MPAAASPPLTTFAVPDVELFTLGTHRDNPYTPADFKAIVTNFKRFSTGANPLQHVPVVLGHDEEQEILQREGEPAAAWLKSIRFDPDSLLRGHMGEMHPEVARLIEGKAYRKVSPEIYDYPPEGVPGGQPEILAELKRRGIDPARALAEAKRYAPAKRKQVQAAYDRDARAGIPEEKRPRVLSVEGYIDDRLRQHLGPMVRRIALLGADVPQDRRLKDIPAPVPELRSYSERTPARRFAAAPRVLLRFTQRRRQSCCSGPNCYACFSEVFTMPSRDELIELLTQKGISPAALQNCPDEALAEWLRSLDGAAPTEEPAPDPEPTPTGEPDHDDMGEHKPGDAGLESPGVSDAPYEEPGLGEDVPGGPDAYQPEEGEEGEEEDPTEKYTGYEEYEEEAPTEDMAEDEDVSALTAPPPKKMKAGCKSYSETEADARLAHIERRLAKANRDAATAEKFAERRLVAERKAARSATRARIDSELLAMTASGQILPSQRDAGMFDHLYELPDDKVRKYAERASDGQVVYRDETAVDNALRKMRGGPVLKSYSEKVKTAPAGTKAAAGTSAGTGEDAQASKIRQHVNKYAEVFRKQGTTAETLIEGFQAARKAEPHLTADQFLGLAS